MTIHNGYLLIADISGYTTFLTSSEQDHANPILKSLLTSLVEQVGDPLHFWRFSFRRMTREYPENRGPKSLEIYCWLGQTHYKNPGSTTN